MPAYVIAEVEIHDPSRYEEYKRLAETSIAAFGGRYVVRGGDAELWEGTPAPRRLVVLEFASSARAREWYASEVYWPARELRRAIATTRMIRVEGT